MADDASRDRTDFAVPGQMAGYSTDDSAFNASLCLGCRWGKCDAQNCRANDQRLHGGPPGKNSRCNNPIFGYWFRKRLAFPHYETTSRDLGTDGADTDIRFRGRWPVRTIVRSRAVLVLGGALSGLQPRRHVELAIPRAREVNARYIVKAHLPIYKSHFAPVRPLHFLALAIVVARLTARDWHVLRASWMTA
jgi:hypothetical protein